MLVVLKNVRLSFPKLFRAEPVMGGAPKFSANFLIEKGDEQIAEIGKIITSVAQTKKEWSGKAETILKSLKASGSVCLRDGATKTFEGYEGCMFLTASSDKAPLVLDRDKTVLNEKSGRPYAGCYVNAQIDIWAMDNKYGKRINAELKGVQFVRDGDAFGGGGTPASADDFEDLSCGEPSDLLGDDIPF